MPVYAGKLLRIDLTQNTWREEPISDEPVRKWLLGSGLAAKLYYDEMDPSLDPLDPASPLLVFNGVLAGTFAPTGCRTSWCGRSPLTGIWNEANRGQPLGCGAALRRLRRSGDHRAGRAARLPVDQRPEPDAIELRDAGAPVGPGLFRDGRRAAGGDRPEGPGGRHRSGRRESGQDRRCDGRAVALRASGGAGRAWARVLGSKHLKAIVVRGKTEARLPRSEGISRRGQGRRMPSSRRTPCRCRTSARPAAWSAPRSSATCPIRNWTLGSWAEAGPRSPDRRSSRSTWCSHTHCYACPIGCGKEIEVVDGKYACRAARAWSTRRWPASARWSDNAEPGGGGAGQLAVQPLWAGYHLHVVGHRLRDGGLRARAHRPGSDTGRR